ncbi:hypothetical protein ABZ370_26605 [Streptomyces sp. NPDC005962]|uniref:hypothetical protein n=1 Tax=Streptomyces sp. NPDC005962 TaxID=3154466 RepID=UPI0033C5295C
MRRPQQTSMSGPVHLSVPDLEPVPVQGCKICAALDRQRAEARRTGNLSKVTDINVEIRRHQADEAS